MDTVRLSVVLPCLNEAGTIGAQLDRLADQAWSEEWEIIVADNGSTDGTRNVLRSYESRLKNLRLVDASGRKGVNYARNAGAAAARGDAVLFCDADDEVRPGWVAALGDALRTHDVVAGRIDHTSLNEEWSLAGRGAQQYDGLPSLGELTYAVGCNFGVKRSLHELVGGFDEDFLGGADDVDYSWRLQQTGAQIHFEPRAVVAYRFPSDLRSIFQQGRFYGMGYVSLYKKHRGRGLLPQRHPWLLGVLSWAGLLTRMPIPPSKRAFGAFLWSLGWKFGMLEGSLRNRVVLLSIRGIA